MPWHYGSHNFMEDIKRQIKREYCKHYRQDRVYPIKDIVKFEIVGIQEDSNQEFKVSLKYKSQHYIFKIVLTGPPLNPKSKL